MIIEYAGHHYQALNPCKKCNFFYRLCKCLKKENTHARVNLFEMPTTKLISFSIALHSCIFFDLETSLYFKTNSQLGQH